MTIIGTKKARVEALHQARRSGLKKDPKHHPRRWLKYIGEPRGRRIMNLLGSTGGKAIPLAILGAVVTIVAVSLPHVSDGWMQSVF
jgi:hypothetical protein